MGDMHAISGYGPGAASTRVRQDDWFRFLGVKAIYHYYAGLNNNRPSTIAKYAARIACAEFSLRKLDLSDQRVLLSRETSPFSRGGVEERILRNAARGVYDFDDALFDDQSYFRRLLGTQDKCRRATAAADVVIVGNDRLGNWAEQHHKDVRVIPSCVDPLDYAPKTDWSIRGDVPSLVWLGSSSTETHVAQIAPALLEIHQRTGAMLTLISGPQSNPVLDPLGAMIRRVPWSLGTFASALTEADVAIAPLADTPYSLGKCAYKLLQYAATGLPIVGSPVGANEMALQRFDGLAVRSIHDWTEGLSQLLTTSASDRAVRGAAGRSGVETYYSFKAWQAQWCDATGIADAERQSAIA